MAGYPAWDQDSARRIVAELAHLEGATLPMLHALQDEFGYVDPQAVPLIAEALNLSRAEVHGTISFYHDFKTAPQPARMIKLCRAEACQALGCESVVAELSAQSEAAAYYQPTLLANQPFKLRDYFWPINQNDIVVNPNLVQNPGW